MEFERLGQEEFRNVVPQILSHIERIPVCVKNNARSWILLKLIFFNNYQNGIFDVNDIKIDDVISFVLLNPFDSNRIIKDFSIRKNGEIICCMPWKRSLRVCNHEYNCSCIVNHDSTSFPKMIIRCNMFLMNKISDSHADLLNRIYDSVKKTGKFYMSDYDIEIFKLLPTNFQLALNDSITYDKNYNTKIYRINRFFSPIFSNSFWTFNKKNFWMFSLPLLVGFLTYRKMNF